MTVSRVDLEAVPDAQRTEIGSQLSNLVRLLCADLDGYLEIPRIALQLLNALLQRFDLFLLLRWTLRALLLLLRSQGVGGRSHYDMIAPSMLLAVPRRFHGLLLAAGLQFTSAQ